MLALIGLFGFGMYQYTLSTQAQAAEAPRRLRSPALASPAECSAKAVVVEDEIDYVADCLVDGHISEIAPGLLNQCLVTFSVFHFYHNQYDIDSCDHGMPTSATLHVRRIDQDWMTAVMQPGLYAYNEYYSCWGRYYDVTMLTSQGEYYNHYYTTTYEEHACRDPEYNYYTMYSDCSE